MNASKDKGRRWFDVEPQRVTRRNRYYAVLPAWMFVVLLCILLWEILKTNLNPLTASQWPWRLNLFGVAPSATITGALGTLLLARNQFARSVRPSLGWNATGDHGLSAVPVGVDWVVHLYNGGPGLCLVQSIAYMLKTFAGDSSPPVALFELMQMLEGIGLFIDDDYTLNPIGVGAPIPATTTLELVSFNRRALNLIESFDVVIRVTDIVGDEHERMLRCLQGAPCRN